MEQMLPWYLREGCTVVIFIILSALNEPLNGPRGGFHPGRGIVIFQEVRPLVDAE